MAYDKAARAAVRAKKTDEYGAHEVFAVPALRSYPLTDHKKPSAERVRAAWDYIHQDKNRAKLGAAAAPAVARIRAFARRHFPDMALEGLHKGWATDEVYLSPADRAWPLTHGRVPDAGLLQKAWADLHSVQWEARLDDAAMAEAERRLQAWATAHQLPLTPPRRAPRVVMF